MSSPSTKLFIEISEADVVTLRKYAIHLNKKSNLFFNWRTAFNHLLAEARIEMSSVVPSKSTPIELPFNGP